MMNLFAAQSPKAGGGGLSEAEVDALIAAYAAPLVHTHAAADITSGTLDNARVNWAAPSAIGSGTPAAGAFTTLSATSSLSVPANSGINTPNVGDSVILSNGGVRIMRALNLNNSVFSDSVAATFFQLGLANAVFTSNNGAALNRLGFSTTGTIFANVAYAAMPPPTTTLHAFSNLGGAGGNTVINTFTVEAAATATPAAGFGVGVPFRLASSTTTAQLAALAEVYWDVATHAARAAARRDSVYLQATKQTYFEAIANSTGGVKTAVNGATPVIRATHIADPTGGTTVDAEARTAINSILVALENFGILLAS